MKRKTSSSVLAKSMPLLLGALLAPAVGVAEPLPELDCLVEPNQVVDIGAPEHGVVETIAVDRSDTVSANDVLAKLESSEQAADVRKARARVNMGAEIEARKATLAFAERKQQRMRDLFASDAISSYQRDEVETELKMAQMQLQQARDAAALARIELDRASAELNRRTIRSPISGVIVERFVSPGEYINEKPLMRVAQMNPLRIESIAPAALFGKIKPGMLATIVAENYGDQVLDAKVTIVDRLIDPASGTFGIRLELPNPDHTIPSGLNCRLSLLPEQRVAATVKPERPAAVKTAAAPVTEVASQPGEMTAPAPKTAVVQQLANENPPATTDKSNQTAAIPAKPEPLAAVKTAAAPVTQVAAKPGENSAPAATVKSAVVAKDAASRAPTPKDQPIIVAAIPAKQPELACQTFGPFGDDQQLEALLGTLGRDAREVGRRVENDEQTNGFFVATRQMATIAEARALSESMKKFGIEDLAVLQHGQYGGRVSLGLFRQRDYALARQKQLAALGIETELIPRLLKTRQVWLDVEMPVAKLEQAPWKSVAPQVNTADCAPSPYVMAETIGSVNSAR